MHASLRLCAILSLALLTGCATYATPGRGADLSAIGVTPGERYNLTDGAVISSLQKKPLAAFPTAVAVARIETTGYYTRTAQSWGRGRYSIVTTRDIETDAQVQRLEKLPQVLGIAPMSRLLLPEQLDSDLELRKAAAELHADILLIYTIDTTFRTSDLSSPLSIITLGLAPTQKARVMTTASAVFMDTRNGYIYGLAEGNAESNSGLSTTWDSRDSIDRTRQQTECKAFDNLVGEIEKTWTTILRRNAGGPAISVTR